GQYIGMKLDDATRLCEYYGLVVETKDEASLEEEGTVIAQSIEPEEMVEGGTTIVLTYSNGEDPSGVVSYTLQLPADIVEGRYSIDVIDEKGVTRPSSKFNAGYTRSAVVDIAGTGTEKMVVVLANDTTGQSAEIGVYNFDFANVTYTAVRENVAGAFDTVKPQTTEEPTEPPTDPPTDPPTEPQQQVDTQPQVDPQPQIDPQTQPDTTEEILPNPPIPTE
ncbi:MAG: PASTA domain-containing protein, partial [Oscillospiraceae bacterium]|nr:PASTA domain-containing protein [Oscillospiraceae bacterium]